ncbi:hypothetical protein TanjilG_05458 [Lupinus angustifolius]|uniref:Uncharacterized protein n=1 Tax=Lupinus angustifolius TaxID=3871 RepID=A0A4P1QSQ0_LUPAN|nr:hypothetical protein TanjilG_05458 [Lupinus angustifolius]
MNRIMGTGKCRNRLIQLLRETLEWQSCWKELKKNKVWIVLSKEEKEEDIFVMTGTRPFRRPKKRPKNVKKQMDV